MLLSSDIWVYALLRRVQQAGSFATILRKGDPRAGSVLVKVLNRRAGDARVYVEATRGDGERFWMEPMLFEDEAALDAYLEKAAQRDPDIWAVEVDDNEGRHFLTEPVEKRQA